MVGASGLEPLTLCRADPALYDSHTLILGHLSFFIDCPAQLLAQSIRKFPNKNSLEITFSHDTFMAVAKARSSFATLKTCLA